jgi:hypothetical protein
MNATTVGTAIGLFIGAILLVVLTCAFSGILVYFLWNWVMPSLFGLKVITFLQAWALTLLTSLLFKSTTTSSTSSK